MEYQNINIFITIIQQQMKKINTIYRKTEPKEETS